MTCSEGAGSVVAVAAGADATCEPEIRTGRRSLLSITANASSKLSVSKGGFWNSLHYGRVFRRRNCGFNDGNWRQFLNLGDFCQIGFSDRRNGFEFLRHVVLGTKTGRSFSRQAALQYLHQTHRRIHAQRCRLV